MKKSVRKLTALLTVLVMACSLAALPISAAEAGDESEDTAGRKFIYANSPYNTEEKLKALAGTLGAGQEEKSGGASWEWAGGSERAFQSQGFEGSHYSFYRFQAPAAPGEDAPAEREVLVIAVNASQTLKTVSGTVMRRQLSGFTGDNWRESLGLPDAASVTYSPASITGHPEWSAAAGPFYERDTAYKITGWTMADYYAPLTPRRLQYAIAEGKRKIKLTPIYARSGQGKCPGWATLETLPTFTLTIVDDQAVWVAVTPPESVTYGGELGSPSAVQSSLGGGTDGEASFTYRYVGVEETNYNSEKKPSEAGAYQVRATLNSGSHGGVGTSETFYIYKAPRSEATVQLSVPAAGGAGTVYLAGMGLPEDMAKGAALKAPLGDQAGEILAGGKPGDSFFTLNLEPREAGEAWSFPLVLTSGNYEEVKVTVRLTASHAPEGFLITHVGVKSPGVFDYGTSLRDIIDLENCTAALDGVEVSGVFQLAEPGRCYAVGTEPAVQFIFQRGGRTWKTSALAKFAILPAEADPTGWDGPLIRDGYYITTYANSPYNVNLETLRDLLQERKQSYNVNYAGENYDLDAEWHTDTTNPDFDIQGQKPHIAGDILWYDWYSYTADLTAQAPRARGAGNTLEVKAYIRVVPILATPSLPRRLGTVAAEKIETLKADDWSEVLNLPRTASVRYEPVEQPQWSDEYVPPSEKTLSIAGWKLDGILLTPAALRAKAASAGKGSVKLTLTPIYENLPEWATLAGEPVFTLTIIGDTGAERAGGSVGR